MTFRKKKERIAELERGGVAAVASEGKSQELWR